MRRVHYRRSAAVKVEMASYLEVFTEFDAPQDASASSPARGALPFKMVGPKCSQVKLSNRVRKNRSNE